MARTLELLRAQIEAEELVSHGRSEEEEVVLRGCCKNDKAWMQTAQEHEASFMSLSFFA